MKHPFVVWLVISSILIGLAYFGRSILLPLIFSFLLWIIIISWMRLFSKISFQGKFLPASLRNILSFIIFCALILFLSNILVQDLRNFNVVLPELIENAEAKVQVIEDATGFDITSFVQESLSKLNVIWLVSSLTNSLSSFATTLFIVFIYLLYIGNEQRYFQTKLKIVSGSRYNTHFKLLLDIVQSIEKYISVKTAISALTGILSYIVMVIIGVEFAFVWAFIIFAMNFIPTIGSLIATTLPVIFALIAFDTYWQSFALLTLIGGIQLYVGNVLEPKYLWNKLNVSPLLLFFSLYFWNALWWIAGMFIAVPLTVIIMIILLHIPATKSIGIWMSWDGKV